MRMILGIVALFVVIVLIGTLSAKEPLHYEQREYRVVAVHPPTQFTVDLQDVKSGAVYHSVRISKACSTFDRLKVGDHYWLIEATFEGSKGTYRKIEAESVLYKLICS